MSDISLFFSCMIKISRLFLSILSKVKDISKLTKKINTMIKVLVLHGEKKELIKIFGVSHVTVREALNGKLNSPLAIKIRKAAVERGGVEISK